MKIAPIMESMPLEPESPFLQLVIDLMMARSIFLLLVIQPIVSAATID